MQASSSAQHQGANVTSANAQALAPSLGQWRQHPSHVIVASGDSDMQQLLTASTAAGQGSVAWLEVLQWPTLSLAGSGVYPTAMQTSAIHGMPWLPLRLHQALSTSTSPEDKPFEDNSLSIGDSVNNNPCLNSGGAAQTAATAAAAAAAAQVVVSAGLRPEVYPDYLALIGKPEAGVKGVGLSASSAKTLLRRFSSVQDLVVAFKAGAVDAQLKIVSSSGRQKPAVLAGKDQGPASPAVGSVSEASPSGCRTSSSSSGNADELTTSTKLQQALRNVLATAIRRDPDSVPWDDLDQQLARPVEQAAARLHLLDDTCVVAQQDTLGSHAAPTPARLPTPLPDCLGTGLDERTTLAMSWPHNRWHAVSSAPYVQAICQALSAAGLRHKVWHVTQQGLAVDVLVWCGLDEVIGALQLQPTTDSGTLPATRQQQYPKQLQEQRQQQPLAGEEVTHVTVLGPADFAASKLPEAAGSSTQRQDWSAAELGQLLHNTVGTRPSWDHVPRKLQVNCCLTQMR